MEIMEKDNQQLYPITYTRQELTHAEIQSFPRTDTSCCSRAWPISMLAIFSDQ